MRKLVSLIAASAIILSLSGCVATDGNSLAADLAAVKPACEAYPTLSESGISGVTVGKGSGLVPAISVAKAVSGGEVTSRIITPGKGLKFTGNQSVAMEYAVANAANGKIFESTKFDGSDSITRFMKAGGSIDFCRMMSGLQEGGTVVAYLPPKLAHESKGIAEAGVGASDGLLFLLRLTKVFLSKAVGTVKPQQTGFPSVVRAVNGQPGVTFLKTAAPKTQKTATLIQGKGAKLKLGQNIMVHYSGFTWSTKSQFDSSWTRGEPASFKLEKGSLIAGFVDALVGKTIGSQIITIIPPDKGYGAQEQSSIPANSTLIFVIDILGATG